MRQVLGLLGLFALQRRSVQVDELTRHGTPHSHNSVHFRIADSWGLCPFACQIVTDEKPPSTTMFWPVTNDEARGAASQTTAPANSCASPKRPIGVWPMIWLPRSV